MIERRIPVDFLNPGQVFACLGLMEAAEILIGPAEGAFVEDAEGQGFVIAVEGPADPVATVLAFLATAKVVALSPDPDRLAVPKDGIDTVHADPGATSSFPTTAPNSPAALPIRLVAGEPAISLPISHWAEGRAIGRDNVKFWAGSGGYSGAALAFDALEMLPPPPSNLWPETVERPFALSGQQSSSFRFDWRRDYIPLDSGFSPNRHDAVKMVGYPLVELLAAIGLEHARPMREHKLVYRYGLWTAALPTALARPALGGVTPGVPLRHFRMTLGWPGQEGQARAIVTAEEIETA